MIIISHAYKKQKTSKKYFITFVMSDGTGCTVMHSTLLIKLVNKKKEKLRFFFLRKFIFIKQYNFIYFL